MIYEIEKQTQAKPQKALVSSPFGGGRRDSEPRRRIHFARLRVTYLRLIPDPVRNFLPAYIGDRKVKPSHFSA